ncbi:glycosyl-4,4'-diaponeurosporenoate acyltransferase CrtO family protein [Clostridium psychrophilum]|uniref:glycosyl-4,4'-diaponeurosporenoate acyltransferase CrtO family protein n=1 Tax=Clostridium psychrophilum TaxID=132926 RepID=UPI001C0E1C7D|nr:hypothetical protein [Clostridium psychrophilum]MBU3180198.1 hypothetical protein [Clostridium psychrophilum]
MIKINKNTFVKWVIVLMTTVGVALIVLFPLISMSSLAYAIILNFLLMIWMSIVETLLIPELKSSYFNSQPIEMEGKIYKYIGVNFFRKLLVLSGWERSREKENPIRKSLIPLEYYEYRTRTSEFGHTIIAIIILIISIYVCMEHSFKNIIWLTFFNIFLNIYPITLQRYNRPRVLRVIKKLKLRDSKIVYKNW